MISPGTIFYYTAVAAACVSLAFSLYVFAIIVFDGFADWVEKKFKESRWW